MRKLNLSTDRPGLLVSVRNRAEAIAALDGGADVIDIKEPGRGSLGAADARTISEVVGVVDGRAPVTAAMGELVDRIVLQNDDASDAIPAGVLLFKFGLAGCASLAEWQQCWKRTVGSPALLNNNTNSAPVAVVYADWAAAGAPAPNDVLNAAIDLGCPALLVDTWNKSVGSLFDYWAADDLWNFVAEVRSQSLCVVLAGSLKEESVLRAARLMPDLVAVRTAACEGGRGGTVSIQRVRKLKQDLKLARRTATPV